MGKFSRRQIGDIFFSIFYQKTGFVISCKLGDNFHEMSKPIFWKKITIPKCRLLKFLPSMLRNPVSVVPANNKRIKSGKYFS